MFFTSKTSPMVPSMYNLQNNIVMMAKQNSGCPKKTEYVFCLVPTFCKQKEMSRNLYYSSLHRIDDAPIARQHGPERMVSDVRPTGFLHIPAGEEPFGRSFESWLIVMVQMVPFCRDQKRKDTLPHRIPDSSGTDVISLSKATLPFTTGAWLLFSDTFHW